MTPVTNTSPDYSQTHFACATSELAALLVENDAIEECSDRRTLLAARQAYLADSAQQARELHQAAEAIAAGALVGAAFTVAGGAGTIVSAQLPANEAASKDWAALGKGFTDLAAPARAFVGDSSAESHKASAQEAATRAEADRWVASDQQTNMDRAERQADKILDLAGGVAADENAATNAIIGRI